MFELVTQVTIIISQQIYNKTKLRIFVNIYQVLYFVGVLRGGGEINRNIMVAPRLRGLHKHEDRFWHTPRVPAGQ